LGVSGFEADGPKAAAEELLKILMELYIKSSD